ncbi:MAG: M20 family metallopeptidase [Thermodesulfobacteriota bacterium]
MEPPIREILDLTGSLIRFRSTSSRPDQRKACADFITAWLEEHGIPPCRTASEGVDSIAAMPVPGRCKVLLMCHFDVVDGPDTLFVPEERDGRLFGRGAIDDKYAVALAMVLMKRQRALGPDGPLGILLTGDEETGGRNGAAAALSGVKADFCIAMDGGNPDSMIVLSKGILRLGIKASGRAAHGARPWLGVNAIEALMDDLRAVKSLFGADTPDHWHRTLNIGVIRGGDVVNMVPAGAEALLDIRFTENDDPERLLEDIKAAVKGEVTFIRKDSMFSGGNSPLLEALMAAAPEAKTGRAHGATDARFLSDHGIPGVVWGAEGGGSQHSANEYLEIASLEKLYRCLTAFLDGLS